MADYEEDKTVPMSPKKSTPFVRVSPEQWKTAEELAEYVLWYHEESMKDNPNSARMTSIETEILKLARQIKPEGE